MPSERRREAQTHRYFQPWKDLQAANDRLNVDLESAQNEFNHAPSSSRDRALTAFAQLATLRLGVKRCMVSLIDIDTQYILAEATQTVSLVDTSKHSEDDEVWLGSSSLDRHLAVCHITFDSSYTVQDRDGKTETHNALVVEDMREDARFKDREYVKNGSVLFYAGVPIITRSGITIGVYAVSHNEPRRPLDWLELSFMQDASQAVFEHLELSKSRNDNIKAERMARGLTSFIEGYSSVDESAERDGQANMSGRCDSYDGDEAPNRPRPRQLDANTSKKAEVNKLFHRAAKIIRESTMADGVVFLDATSQIIPMGGTVNIESDGSATEYVHEPEGSDREGRVSFRLTRPVKTRSIGTDSNPDLDMKTSASDSDTSPTRRASSEVLGIDVLQNDLNLSSSMVQFPVSKKDLRRCIQRFPAGKIFSMLNDTGTSSGDDTTSEAPEANRLSTKRRKKTTPRRTMADDILKQLPGVQSVLFLPLWDSMGEKWLSGVFLWTNEVGRLTDAEDELPYLKAFANSITSEFARINSLFNERAKTTFIASISHELRSPLHGILGSIEFLHDTSIDAHQSALIGQVETCGKTLLDTINHVLDYSKINDFGTTTKETAGSGKGTQTRSQSGKDVSLNLVADFDLGVLVEEVTEAIFAGRIFNRQRRAERVKSTGVRKVLPRTQSQPLVEGAPGENISNSDTEVVPQNVAVILNISKEDNWNVRAQPGALRRLIMNLLGNAIKYTNQGYVEVSLKSKKDAKQLSRISVELRFSDSGKGMSDEFQRDKLYRAFSQEDPFTEGTGLGLSIVRQIVESLKGKIKIKSQQGLGTEVAVTFSLPRAKSDIEEALEIPASLLQTTRGLNVALIDQTTRDSDRTREAARRIHNALRESCVEWFHSKVSSPPYFEDGDDGVAIFLDAPPIEYIIRQLDDRGGSRKSHLTPVIIICPNAYDAAALRKQVAQSIGTDRHIEIIAQPCGPRKLSKALEQCILDKSPPIADQPHDTGSSPTSNVVSPSAEEKDLPILTHGYSFTNPSPLTPPNILISREPAKPLLRTISSSTTSQPEPDIRPPLTAHPEGTVPTIATLPPVPRPRIPNILLVDDNRINLQLLVTFMKKSKFHYAAASNGLEALNLYKAAADALLSTTSPSHTSATSSTPTPTASPSPSPTSPSPSPSPSSLAPITRPAFDYILMDISMPIMDGNSSTRHIRAYEKEKKLPAAKIFALTGLASASAQEESFASGIDQFLPKPVNFRELKGLLERVDDIVAKE